MTWKKKKKLNDHVYNEMRNWFENQPDLQWNKKTLGNQPDQQRHEKAFKWSLSIMKWKKDWETNPISVKKSTTLKIIIKE